MKKFVLRMLMVPLMMSFVLSLSAQDVVEKKVTISVQDVLARTALAQLRVAAGVLFVFEEGAVDTDKKVSLSYENVKLGDVLKDLCGQLGLRYTLKKNMVLLIPHERNDMVVTKYRIVKGKVVDEIGQPLAGVTIYATTNNIGTVSDANGDFSIKASIGELLSFNFIGMQNVTMKVTEDPTLLKVKMEADNAALQEVVVTGYQSIDKGRYVGAVSHVKMDEALIVGEMSIDQMLQGVVPGMTVQMGTGQVGASAKVRVRGTSTLLGSKEPLWVVDGVVQYDPFPMSDEDYSAAGDADNLKLIAGNCISWLNPNDIETLTVLKDASATAIYGAKAANGVIVITTKRATNERLSISYRGEYTVGEKPSYGMYNLMNSQEKMQLSKDFFDEKVSYISKVLPIGYSDLMDELQSKNITYDEFVQKFRQYEYQNTNWFDLLFRNSFSQSHNISLSGGSSKVLNRTSLSYNKSNGEATGNDVTLLSFNSNTTFTFGKKFQLSATLRGSERKANGFAFGVDPFIYASTTSRTIPVYNEDGTFYYHTKWGTEASRVYNDKMSAYGNNRVYNYNILNERDNTGNQNNTRTLGATFDLEWKFLSYLSYKGLYSYTLSSSTIKTWATERSFYIAQYRGYEYGDPNILPNSNLEKSSPLPFGGVLQNENASNRNYTFRNSLVFNRLLKNVHSVTASLGIEATSNKNTGTFDKRYGYLYYRGERFANVPVTTYYQGSYTGNYTGLLDDMRNSAKVTNRENNYLSEYFTGVYSYDNRYVLNLNTRLDASNRFGQDNNKKFRPAWSLGAKWRLANENFMDKMNFIDVIDLSVSYGYQGNVVESVSPFLIATDGGQNAQTGLYYLNVKSLPYPDLGWEKTKSWNTSADVSFFHGRLSFVFNLFGKNSDVLYTKKIPAENGMLTSPIFGTKLKNRGYDLIVSLIPVQTKNFSWQLTMNTGITHNSVSNEGYTNTLDDYLNGTAIVDGEPYSTFWSFKFNGLDPEDGRPLFDKLDIDATANYSDFLVKTGKLEPDFSGGLFTRFRYKEWSLSASFSVSFGSQKRLPNLYNISNGQGGLPLPEENNSRNLIDRWKRPGDEAYTVYPSLPTPEKASTSHGNENDGAIKLPVYPIRLVYNRYQAYNLSDIRVADADFIRCRQLILNYRFSKKALKWLNLKNMELGLSMTNPFLIAFDKKWDGYDPETGGWPARKTYSLTLNATF